MLANNTAIPITLGGSTTSSHPIVALILRQHLAYLYIHLDHGRVYAAPDKN
jgi:hypothetical protein